MAFVWDSSWVPGRRHTVEGALERIERMLTRAYLSVQAVNRDAAARAIYGTHFGDPHLIHLFHVQNVIRLMHQRVTLANQTITLSYVVNQAAFQALGVGALPAGLTVDLVEAFVNQRGVAAATPLRLFVCPQFFTRNVYLPNAVNQRTGTGTVLHELSHGVGNTEDHAYTWAAGYAALSSVRRTRNADSYRAYCQSFDQVN